MSKKYILWDFDGTLAFNPTLWSSALTTLFRRHGIETPSANDAFHILQTGFPWHQPEIPHHKLFDGRTWWEYFGKLIESKLIAIGVPNDSATKVSCGFRDEIIYRSGYSLYDDVIPALERTKKAGFSNVILSNHFPEIDQIIGQLGVLDRFEEVFTSGTIGYEKPHPKIWKHAMSLLGNPAKAVMIGDNFEADIKGASSQGIPAILVRTENRWKYPNHCENLDCILDVVEGVFAEST